MTDDARGVPGVEPGQVVQVWTDGACVRNPGPGGWAVLIREGGEDRTLYGREYATTNIVMEMTAAIRALEALPAGTAAVIVSDSETVVKGFNEWRAEWKASGWRTSKKKPVKNVDLWQRLDALAGERRVVFKWVRGHAGHAENERVDVIAKAEAREAAKEVKERPGLAFGFTLAAE